MFFLHPSIIVSCLSFSSQDISPVSLDRCQKRRVNASGVWISRNSSMWVLIHVINFFFFLLQGPNLSVSRIVVYPHDCYFLLMASSVHGQVG